MNRRSKSPMWWFTCCVLCVNIGMMWACAPKGDPLPQVAPSQRDKAVEGNNKLAVALYQQLRDNPRIKQAPYNLFFSPYSVSSALTMTYAGAVGDTAKEMRSALQLQLPDQEIHLANSWLAIDLNNRGQAGDFTFTVANRLWGRTGLTFESAFMSLMKVQYLAGMERLDFQSDPNAARQTINKWVEDKTNQKIKDLLPEGSINSEISLVLTNAIYFKGNWKNKFDKDATTDRAFALVANEKPSVQVPMMSKVAPARYATTDNAWIVAMPYKGEQLEMVLVVPKDQEGLFAIEKDLTYETLSGWLSSLAPTDKVGVIMPKFKFTYKEKLKTAFIGLGMQKAFGSGADFSGMTTEENLHIDQIFHKAFIEVNEEGSEAAAATAVTMKRDSAGPSHPTVLADHPFLFMIHDKSTGSILFMGRVHNPLSE